MNEDKKLKKLYKKDIYGKTRKSIIDLAFNTKRGIPEVDPTKALTPMPPMQQPFPMPPMMGPEGPPMPPQGPPMMGGMEPQVPQAPMMPPQAQGAEYDPMLMIQLLKSLAGSQNEPTIPAGSRTTV